MICPKCESEYVKGITVCADCGTVLIPKEEFMNDLVDIKDWTILLTTDVAYEAEMIKANLEGANIKSIILSQKDKSFPSSGDLSIIKLLVKTGDLEDAKAIVSDISKSDK